MPRDPQGPTKDAQVHQRIPKHPAKITMAYYGKVYYGREYYGREYYGRVHYGKECYGREYKAGNITPSTH